jgi:hypothetical protein
MSVMDKAGGRKFVIAILGVASASLLAWFKHITPDAYSTVMVAVVGLYGASNVLQKVLAK